MINEKSEWRNPLFYLFSKTWMYSLGRRRKIITLWVMFIAAESTQLFLNPFIWAKVIDVVQKEGVTKANFPFLLELLLLTLGITVLFWSLHGPARLIECATAFQARVAYRQKLLLGVFTLPLGWHSEHHSGDTIDKIEKGTVSLYQFSAHSFEIIYGIVRLTGSYIVLAYFSPSAAGIVLVMIGITTWITLRFDRVLIRQYRELNHAENRIAESTFDAISNITTVIILRVERLIFRTIVGKMQKPFDLFKQNNRLNELKWFLTNLCCSVMTVSVLGIYFWSHIGTPQGILAGNVFLLIQYLGKISDMFFRFTALYGDILQRKTRVMNSEELTLDFKPENYSNHILPNEWKTIRVENLTFTYEDAKGNKPSHLENISFEIHRGERIAFVGESGSGKTTCLKIMRQLFEPQTLRLFVDDILIPQGFEGISRAITLVPQEPEIFATTILGNITFDAEYPMDRVTHYVEMARFQEVVEKLPRGYDSSIKEKGVNLSTGQKQRLGLARGFLACSEPGKEVLLFDEPTSSLDALTEVTVYENLFREFKGKTIISVIHKLHLLSQFDRIYVFEKGSIIASGSFGELLEQCPYFRELWQRYQLKEKGKGVNKGLSKS